MSRASALLARACGLPRAQTEDVVREKDRRVTMDDGAVLVADRWVARDHAPGVSQVTAPVQRVGGWYDIFLPSMLEDHAARQAAGLELV